MDFVVEVQSHSDLSRIICFHEDVGVPLVDGLDDHLLPNVQIGAQCFGKRGGRKGGSRRGSRCRT